MRNGDLWSRIVEFGNACNVSRTIEPDIKRYSWHWVSFLWSELMPFWTCWRQGILIPLNHHQLKACGQTDSMIPPDFKLALSSLRRSAKVSFARPGATFVTFAICPVLCGARQGYHPFKSWWYHSVRMGQGLQGAMVAYIYSKFLSSENMSENALEE